MSTPNSSAIGSVPWDSSSLLSPPRFPKRASASVSPPHPVSCWNPSLSATQPARWSFVVDGSSVTNHIERDGAAKPGSISVQMALGDQVCERLGHVPNVIKIDVEGFEEEVLRGLSQTLTHQQLRTVLVEVHFLQLEQRGQPQGAAAH